MSARTEQLLIEINELEEQLAAAPAESPNLVALREQLLTRRRELSAATQALTEGKKQQLLKD